MNNMDAWNIKQIANELAESYAECYNSFEQSMWRVIVAKDCKRILDGRKPTPAEQAILDKYRITV